jgi:2-polyprenyl-6-methoxyphenol hydroxylase-like FAD-dependent oxidoreductase
MTPSEPPAGSTDTEVLIVGAGPTGLVLALWLTALGVGVRIIDEAPEAGTTSRALAVQPRTLELYRQLDLASAVVERGQRVPAVNLWARGAHAARMPFAALGERLTAFPFMLIYPQDEHEALLAARLRALGVTVERRTQLLGFSDDDTRISARLRSGDGSERSCTARYLAGCDGARSTVRVSVGTGFPGGTYRHLFYVADIEGAGPAVNGELHVDLDEADFLAVFPLAGAGRARLVGTVRDERADRPESLHFDDVSHRALEHLKLTARKVNWFSTYHVHHRVTEHFRRGRAFLLGDAAHIHSPAGGQGMNTGIGDAVNLAWKLAAVLRGCAADGLLDSYESERIGFARRLVATTDRVFTFATAEGPFADLMRTRLAPALIPRAFALEPIRQYLFRTVSQILLNYRGMPLSEGTAGQVHGGDRMPWVREHGSDNHAPLAAIGWQVHVYGRAGDLLRSWCERSGVPLHVFAWSRAHEEAGLARDALYLLRPDTYVALAAQAPDPASLERYVSERQLRLRPRQS